MKNKKVSGLLSVLLIAFATLGNAAEKTINIDGSSTVYPITKSVADSFHTIRKVKMDVGYAGTGAGFIKFCSGETQVQNASRPILKKEMTFAKKEGFNILNYLLHLTP